MLDKKAARELLGTLVRTDTAQPEGNERELVSFIKARYEGRAASVVVDHSETRASLALLFKGGDSGRCVAFAGHLDTVSCDPSVWTHGPHDAFVDGDVMYGRGCADMKGGVASMLLTADEIAEGRLRPFCDVMFLFTADEEAGGMGARAMCEREELKRVDAMFICEPSAKGLGICEKGALWLRVTAKGRSCHASRPDLGINAAQALIEFWNDFSRSVERADDPQLGSSSVCLTRISGGTLTNVVPEDAFIEIDVRTVPSQSHNDIIRLANAAKEKTEARFSGCGVGLEIINNRPAVGTAADHPFVKAVSESAEMAGLSPALRGLHFYTDASQLIPKLGVPFVILGPGDDALAHTVDEHVSINEVKGLAEVYCEFLRQDRAI